MNLEANATLWRTELEQNLQFLAGGGELGARMRAFDWAATSLGPAEHWPQSLKTAVRIMLTSRQPIWIDWGRDLIYLYNDPYKSIIGGKDAWALGRPTGEVWREICDDIGPMLSKAMRGDEGTYVEEQLLIIERHGYPEETYYTFSYSPIPNDDGSAGGIICANTDDTQRVIGERQLSLLRELATGTAEARSWQQACEQSARALASDAQDLPFAVIYLLEPGTNELTLAGASGIAQGHQAAPLRISLDDNRIWPLAEIIGKQQPSIVADLSSKRFGALPTGAWRQPPTRPVGAPLVSSDEMSRSGVLIVGRNPFRVFDDGYRGFLGLVAGQITAAISNAQAYAEERGRTEVLAELDRAKTAFFPT